MALDVTVGGPTADSYASLIEANDYAAARTFSQEWDDADDSEKEALLKEATRLLDSVFRWTGAALTAEQALTWPRSGMLYRTGFPIPEDVIPRDLKNAQSEWAIRLKIDATILDDNDAQKLGIVGIKAGPIELKYGASGNNRSYSLESYEAELRRQDPDFDWLARYVPDAVRVLIPPSWYLRPPIGQPILFDAMGGTQ